MTDSRAPTRCPTHFGAAWPGVWMVSELDGSLGLHHGGCVRLRGEFIMLLSRRREGVANVILHKSVRLGRSCPGTWCSWVVAEPLAKRALHVAP